jgi:uncharacterized SAM-binding protein YcdF (DUF218 family)
MAYLLFTRLVQPLVFLNVLWLLGLGHLWRRGRESRGRLLLVTLPWLALIIGSLPLFSDLALGTLLWRYPPLRTRPADASAIVVLGGSMRSADAVRDRPELTQSTFNRCRLALELYQRSGACPVLVSGGRVYPSVSGPALGDVMRDSLSAWGMDAADILVEDRAGSTHENAVESARILRQREIRKVVLVTDATHMLRARRAFDRQGIEVVPAPCNIEVTRYVITVWSFVPTAKSALRCETAWHEWVGIAWYWWKGWI